MNEQLIQELAIDCAGQKEWDFPKDPKSYTFTPDELEKFAESLIWECIDKIQNYDLVPGHSAKWEDIYDIHARLLDDLGEELKENFGIEK